MTQKELNALLNFLQKQSSPETNELISIVLKMASDSAALKAVKDKPSGKDTGEKKIFEIYKTGDRKYARILETNFTRI